MRFHTFGNPENKAIVLIHGVLTPWQIWNEPAEILKKDYYMIVPALDAHTEEDRSEFVSVEEEAEAIEDYIAVNRDGKVHAVCGLSMGGVITGIIWKNGRIKSDYIVMDGAPFTPIPKLAVNFMTNSYLKIIHSSKKREPKVLESFKKDFLPEKYLESYLKIADKMSDESVRNMISSVFGDHYPENVQSNAKVMYLHGTKGNESAAVKSAKRLKKDYPDMKIVCRKGHAHCENALFHPDKWCGEITEFIK